MGRLGINLSIPRLQKQSGISEEDLEPTPRGSICAAEKIAIVDSAKLQKLFGVDSKIVRLMHILGASEEELAGWIHSDGKLVNIPESEDNDSNEEKLEDEDDN